MRRTMNLLNDGGRGQIRSFSLHHCPQDAQTSSPVAPDVLARAEIRLSCTLSNLQGLSSTKLPDVIC